MEATDRLKMNPDQKKSDTPESSETNEQDNGSNSEQEKSEEFKNFENGMRAIVGLKKDQVERVKAKTPYPKKVSWTSSQNHLVYSELKVSTEYADKMDEVRQMLPQEGLDSFVQDADQPTLVQIIYDLEKINRIDPQAALGPLSAAMGKASFERPKKFSIKLPLQRFEGRIES
jgi:hypothetical protein